MQLTGSVHARPLYNPLKRYTSSDSVAEIGATPISATQIDTSKMMTLTGNEAFHARPIYNPLKRYTSGDSVSMAELRATPISMSQIRRILFPKEPVG